MNGPTLSIVVGTGGIARAASDADAVVDATVVAAAASLAQRPGTALHVVHVVERPDLVQGPYTRSLEATSSEPGPLDLEHSLGAGVHRYAGTARTCCRVVGGDPAIQLTAFADEAAADLLIVGASRREGRQALGHTAERVLQRTRVPTLVIRRALPRPIRRVLLTTDLSELSAAFHESALDLTLRLLEHEPLELCTLLVCWYDAAVAARVSQDFMIQAAMSRLTEFLGERRRRSHGVRGEVRLGNPSTEIVREAEEWDADLLVIGTHGRWGISPWRLGSTAAATVREARCDTLVIPASHALSRRSGEARAPSRTAFPGTEEHADPAEVLATV